ncbi:MAG: type I toxin-antitoxin system SymE family toxin [Candidatus Azobacteroides sp.]|nr:type I toxin-antitoxin system SymE family toxin [Candidatus Azobacteroides sp.]
MSGSKKEIKREKSTPPFVKKVLRKASTYIIPEESILLKKEVPDMRYLRLQPRYRALKYSGNSIVPELRLNGRWLENAGFRVSEYVSITVMNGLLIVRPVNAPEEAEII